MDQLTGVLALITENYLIQAALTILVFLILLFTRWAIKKSITRLGKKFSHDPNRTAAIKRLLIFGLWTLCIVILILIWGGDLENLWVSLGSILGLIAIGFFAIWSILSNIIAGIIIYTVNPFRIGDTIVLVEKEVTGKVKDIGLIYTSLEDKDGIFTVPNNIFFQQIVKVKKR